MKKYLIGHCMSLIKHEKPELDEVKLEEIEYGLTGLYLTFTKVFIILLLSALLGIVREYFIFLAIYIIIRTNAYGMHAKNSWICLIISTLSFVGVPLCALYLVVPWQIKYLLGILTICYIFKYSPADTQKRPIINKQKRLRHKLSATLTAIIFVITSIFLTNNFVSNCFFMSLLLMCVMISPITYRIFHLPYNNYLKYVS